MQNKDVFHFDPKQTIWKNQGVAKVDGSKFIENLDELKFELLHFVCEGQYQKGLEKVLLNFLGHIDQDEQKAVWISGFFGSGKSHLCKMLRALWENTRFSDGLTARGAVALSPDIQEYLRELDTKAKQQGGLVAVSGTLAAGSASHIRRTLAELVCESRGLPADIPKGRLVLWMRREGIEDGIRRNIEAQGKNWQTEINNFRLSSALWQAVAEAKPVLGSAETIRDLFKAQYPNVGNNDITNSELVSVLREILAPGGTFPLTLIILDEMQRFIGDDGDRSLSVQQLGETLVSCFKGKLLLVGTGQNALSGTANLRPLMDRFTVSVDLQDADVDTVLRKTVLQKKPDVLELGTLLEDRMGEISRHLHGNAAYQWKSTDSNFLVADYPLLATRRRVWEWAHRAMDGAGTNSQLRGQLRLLYEALEEYADRPLGEVIRGDYIFDKNSTGLLQASILSNELNNQIQSRLASSTDGEKLQGRVLSMVFILNRLSALQQDDKKIPATETSLTDLLLENMKERPALESRMAPALEELVKAGLLQRIDDAYSIQTKEGSAWHQQFEQERSALANNASAWDALRMELIKTLFKSESGNLTSLAMGNTSQSRPVEMSWSANEPSVTSGLGVWIQDGTSADESSVLRHAQARRDGTLVYVFIPRESSGELAQHVRDMSAAKQTINLRISATGPEADSARLAMQDREKSAKDKAGRIVRDLLAQAKVWVSGGIQMDGMSLSAKLEDACARMLLRKYPDFAKGDQAGWSQVITLCKQGTTDVSTILAHPGNPLEHPVCRLVLDRIGASAKWEEIVAHFDGPSYGWPKDTTEGALYLLWGLNAIEIHITGTEPASMARTDRRDLRKSTISSQIVVVSAEDKMKFRSIMMVLDPKGPMIAGKELDQESEGFACIQNQHRASGSQAPAPAPASCPLLEEATAKNHGSERLKFLASHVTEFKALIEAWKAKRDTLAKRQALWQRLQDLLARGTALAELQELREGANAIYINRSLLAEPDPVSPLLRQGTDVLRSVINNAWNAWRQAWEQELEAIGADPDWQAADPAQRASWLALHDVQELQAPELGTDEKVLASVQKMSLSTWQDQTDALSGRFAKLRAMLIHARQPKAQTLRLKRANLNNQAELEAWLSELRSRAETALSQGPVILE